MNSPFVRCPPDAGITSERETDAGTEGSKTVMGRDPFGFEADGGGCMPVET